MFQLGNDVQVIARLVETETGQILVSHTELIPKNVFVGITQYLVELRNSVLLDYTLLFLDDTAVSTAALAYRYSFSRGLSFAFQLFVGGNHGVIPTSTTVGSGPGTEYFEWESSFTEMGLAVLFGLGSASFGAMRWELQLGPVLATYHDETGLIRFTESSVWYDGGEEIDNWYMMFGLSGSVLLDFNLSRHVGLYLGGQFQFFPEQSIEEQVWYYIDPPVYSWSTVIFSRDITLTGGVIKAGMRYSF